MVEKALPNLTDNVSEIWVLGAPLHAAKNPKMPDRRYRLQTS